MSPANASSPHRPQSQEAYVSLCLPLANDETIWLPLMEVSQLNWEVFTPNVRSSFCDQNVWVRPWQYRSLEKSMAACQGIVCEAEPDFVRIAATYQKPMLILASEMEEETLTEMKKRLSDTIRFLRPAAPRLMAQKMADWAAGLA
ncbi:MAG: hypothetical protein AAF206_19260 [Bacteroidota bacterium]